MIKYMDKLDKSWKSTIILFVVGMGYYLHRLSLIPNCLFRLDNANIERFSLGAIPEGLIGPLRSIYLAVRHKGLNEGLVVFKDLFLSKDNPIMIFSALAFIKKFFL